MNVKLTIRYQDGTENVICTENVERVVYDAGLKSIIYAGGNYSYGFNIQDKEIIKLEILEG